MIRPMTVQDYTEMAGHEPLHSALGIAVDVGEKLAGLAGYEYNSLQVFSMQNDLMRDRPVLVMKVAKRLMKAIDAIGGQAYARASKSMETAPRFLEHLGFELVYKDSNNGDMYRRMGG